MSSEGYRVINETELNCGHLFTAEIIPLVGDIIWCASCGCYSSYGSPNIRKRGYRNDRTFAEWRQDNPNWLLDVHKGSLR